jgi:uncharacterized membrane protein YfcA
VHVGSRLGMRVASGVDARWLARVLAIVLFTFAGLMLARAQ